MLSAPQLMLLESLLLLGFPTFPEFRLHALVGVPVIGVVGPAVPVLLNDVVLSL